MKDLYAVLRISPNASAEAIKKAFRKLALQYHPDRNNEPGAVAVFRDIQEAYRILGDPTLRAAYHYERSIKGTTSTTPLPSNADDLLVLARKLSAELSGADPFRLNFDMVSFRLTHLLQTRHIDMVQSAGPAVREQFIRHLLPVLELLPLPLLASFLTVLKGIAPAAAAVTLAELRQQKRLQHYWATYKVLLALTAAALFCLLVWLAGRK